MNLRSKIYLLGLLPLAFFIISISTIALNYFKTFSNSDDVYSSMKMSDTLSLLIHETQKERGATSAYLGGAVAIKRVKDQWIHTDKFLAMAESNLIDVKVGGKYEDILHKSFLKYKKIRSKVLRQSLSSEDAVTAYSEIVSAFMDYNDAVASFSESAKVTAANKSLKSLESVKEYAGKLRAVSTSLIGQNKPLSEESYRKVSNLLASVNFSINSNSLVLSKESTKLKRAFLESSEWVKTKQRINVLLSKRNSGNYGISASDHINTMTHAIDKLDKLIKFQLEQTMNIVQKQKDKAIGNLWLLCIIITLSSLLVIYCVFKISKNLISSLTKISAQMVSGIDKINQASENIKQSSQDLSVSSEQQAAAMQQTSATMTEIEAMITRNTDDSKVSSDIATNSFSEVKIGVEKIQKMTKTLNTISSTNQKVTDQVNESNEKMNEISQIIKSIGDKTQVINDIVFQTKLLSFNASVEAARAGEHGQGFAVVAEEIGNLAQMSGKAAEEICQMLEESTLSVDRVAKEQKDQMEVLTRKSKMSVDNGIDESTDLEDFLSSLSEKMNLLKNNVSQISLASDEQSQGVVEISTAINEVNDSTGKNSQIANNSNIIANELSLNISEFNNVVADLEALISSKA